MTKPKIHFVIPDCQVKPGKSVDYLRAIGEYIVHKQPDRIICLGDFADMESLSSYDKGKASFEGRRYAKDIEASHKAMEALIAPLRAYNVSQVAKGLPIYRPTMDLTLGNHEDRINRAANDAPEFEGLLGIHDLRYEDWGWSVHKFKEVIVRDGVAYSHYFAGGVMGRPIGSAAALLSKKHMSCIAGHQQGYQIATTFRADGRQQTGIITGSSYEHDEDYLGPQGNKHWRGFLILHDVEEGEFQTQQVSLKHAKRKFPSERARAYKRALQAPRCWK
jgi:hypothetical protein